MWSDGVNCYYSSGETQYVLDMNTRTWQVKEWTGMNNFEGQYVWTDGEKYYYSNDTVQYVMTANSKQ